MTKTIAKVKGFSLLELIIVLGLIGAIMGAAISSLMEGLRGSEMGRAEAEIRHNLQDVLTLMVKEIGHAGYPPPNYYDGHYLRSSGKANLVSSGIMAGSTAGKLMFSGDINSDNRVDYVEYELVGDRAPFTLTRRAGAISHTGALPSGSAQKLSSLVESCRFSYFDATGRGTSVMTEVATIRIDLTIRSKASDPQSNIYRTISRSVRVKPFNL